MNPHETSQARTSNLEEVRFSEDDTSFLLAFALNMAILVIFVLVRKGRPHASKAAAENADHYIDVTIALAVLLLALLEKLLRYFS